MLTTKHKSIVQNLMEENKYFFDISPIECAALSYDVYNDPNKPALPTNWNKFKSIETQDGYSCALYFKPLEVNTNDPDSPPFIYYLTVLAHRGTDNTQDVYEDYLYFMDKIPARFAEVMDISINLHDDFNKKYERCASFVHTGHSLGSIYAELAAAKFNDLRKSNQNLAKYCAITFENPGTKTVVEKAVNLRLLSRFSQLFLENNCIIYQADVNIINSAKDHGRTIFRLNMPYNYYAPPLLPKPLSLQPSWNFNPHYIFGYSFGDQHRMLNVFNCIKKDASFIKIPNHENNPGLAQSYLAYLNYDSRKRYWKGYFNACWDAYPELKIQYFGNFKKFKKDSVNHLKVSTSDFVSQQNSPTDITVVNDSKCIVQKSSLALDRYGIFKHSSKKAISKNNVDDDFVLINKNELIEEMNKENSQPACAKSCSLL